MKMDGSQFEQLQVWLTDYMVKVLASVGTILGAAATYRIAITGHGTILLLPAVAIQFFPFVFLFRKKIGIVRQRVMVSGIIMLAILSMVLHRGLASHFLLLAPLLMLSLIIFYGRRGFNVCLSFLLITTLAAMAIDLHNGFVIIEMDSTQAILMRAMTLMLITAICCFAFRGFYLAQQAQDEIITVQADTIDKQKSDITQQNQRADLVTQKLALLEDTLNCLVLIIHFDGTISFQNKYASSVLEGSLLGRSCLDIALDEESSEAFSNALTLSAADKNIDQFSFRLTGLEGQQLNFVAACAPRLDLSGRPIDMVVAATDVTELRKQRDRLRNLGKLEAVGLACARIAHDFANLLMIIEANLELLDQDSLDPKQRTYVEHAIKAAQDSVTLTRQIGEFSASPRISRKSIKLSDFMEEVYDNSQTLCPNRLRVNSDWSFSSEAIEIDGTHINIVILNLVANARDAISDEGDITIRARLNPSGESGKAVFCLDVVDDGCGIPQENIDKVKEPFFSTKSLKTGMGLGLSTSSRLVEEMGGLMTISSSEVSGTTVSISLPVDVSS